MKNVLIPLASGFEEIEFICIADILRRASLNVIVASLDSNLLVKGANNINIQADTSLEKIDVKSLSAIALPGGYEGMKNLCESQKVIEILQDLHKNGKLVSAICASPIVLNKAGLINGEFTCYPGCEAGLAGKRVNKPVVVNGNVVTSAGPATASLFALELVKILCGDEAYKGLYEGIQMPLLYA